MLLLTRRAPSPIPLEVEGIVPEKLAGLSRLEAARLPVYHGNRTEPLGEWFDVAGDAADGVVRFAGDTATVKHVGAGMTTGRVEVEGGVGMHAGAGMRGGSLTIHGDAGDWLGAEMKGGRIAVFGSAGSQVGAAYRGSRRGMTGGEIHVRGSAGDEVGLLMRRGLVAVGGACGQFAGASMIAGSVFVFGAVGGRAGAGMKRGTVFAGGGVVNLPPSFREACDYAPTFLPVYARHVARVGVIPVGRAAARVRCWRGDLLHGGTGEVLVGDGPAGEPAPAFVVREYRPADAPALLDVFRTAIRRTAAADYNAEQVRAWSDADPATWAGRFEGRYVRVAVVAGTPVGFAELESNGHVDRVYVSPDHGRRGIGRALVSGLIEEAKRRGLRRLWVEVSLTARPCFESAGFRVVAPQVVTCRGAEFVNYRMERVG
ncbi:formylmethanofuran dehydrogenase subunit C [Urbifossiella limnaea]|uniref:Formyltransferase/hydrolase complex Fhc subunit C n=1 Tax=Urbifossiella limnaea TaxID=2528023 RepID=A0A517XR30_9BACT|nr:formylmethanofuran dehydrogenase subunit C [Urbifossiella limnaea]QDU19978.1 Formyltransferase/hydrolase complex Fhc subunit C [Urbifossiella limnaea]